MKVGTIRNNNKGTPMKIIAVRSSQDMDVEFLDEYHYVKYGVASTNFNKGCIKNPFDKTVCGVGYIGVGKHEAINKNFTGKNRKMTPVYNA